MHRLVISCMLFLLAPGLAAVELPAPAELLKQMGVSGHYVTVVEPHQSDASHQTDVTYLAVAANQVLDHLFGRRWPSSGSDVVFTAADGYQFAGGAERFTHYKAYLAYARADGNAFTIVNSEGQRTELGPYYLIWDNIEDTSLIRQGAYGWPYQVLQIDLRPASAYLPLLPQSASRQDARRLRTFQGVLSHLPSDGRNWRAEAVNRLAAVTLSAEGTGTQGVDR